MVVAFIRIPKTFAFGLLQGFFVPALSFLFTSYALPLLPIPAETPLLLELSLLIALAGATAAVLAILLLGGLRRGYVLPAES